MRELLRKGLDGPLTTLGSFPECCLKPPPSQEMGRKGMHLQSLTAPDSWLPWKRWNQALALRWPSPCPPTCSSPHSSSF